MRRSLGIGLGSFQSLNPPADQFPITDHRLYANGVAFSQTIWALVTFTGDAPYSVSATLAVNVDLAPPPPPGFNQNNIGSGNEGLNVTWTGIDPFGPAGMCGVAVIAPANC